MCCSMNCETVRAATQYHTQAWQKLSCNTLSQLGLANVNTENNVLSSLLYTFLSRTPGLNGNEALCCCILMGMKSMASDLSTISRIATH